MGPEDSDGVTWELNRSRKGHTDLPTVLLVGQGLRGSDYPLSGGKEWKRVRPWDLKRGRTSCVTEDTPVVKGRIRRLVGIRVTCRSTPDPGGPSSVPLPGRRGEVLYDGPRVVDSRSRDLGGGAKGPPVSGTGKEGWEGRGRVTSTVWTWDRTSGETDEDKGEDQLDGSQRGFSGERVEWGRTTDEQSLGLVTWVSYHPVYLCLHSSLKGFSVLINTGLGPGLGSKEGRS